MAEIITIHDGGSLNLDYFEGELAAGRGPVPLRIAGGSPVYITAVNRADNTLTAVALEPVDAGIAAGARVTFNSAAGESAPAYIPYGSVAQDTTTGTYTVPVGSATTEDGAWSSTKGYPGVVALFQQRLWFAGSPSYPDRIWGSQVADYENFGEGVADDDAVTYQLAFSGVNQIRWMKALPAGLAIGTAAGELTLEGGADNPLTPTNVRARERTFYGSDPTLDALRAINLVLFVQRGALRIRELTWSIDLDNYVAPDLTVVAEHLTRQGIVDFARAASPDSLLFIVTGDGLLLVCAYDRPENVVGWSRHTTDGTFESVCVIPNACGTGDEVWVVVNRTIGGVSKRYVEVFDGRLNTDSGLVYEGEATGSFTGLDHLNGKTLKVVTNTGAVYDLVVTGGAITLPAGAAGTAVEAGLHYTSTLVTVRPEIPTQQGTAQARRKHWSHLTARLYCTESQLLLNGEFLIERPEGIALAGEYTGDMARLLNFGWDREGQLVIQSLEPKTVTILGLTGGISIEDP
jgi:hypothetical protein